MVFYFKLETSVDQVQGICDFFQILYYLVCIEKFFIEGIMWLTLRKEKLIYSYEFFKVKIIYLKLFIPPSFLCHYISFFRCFNIFLLPPLFSLRLLMTESTQLKLSRCMKCFQNSLFKDALMLWTFLKHSSVWRTLVGINTTFFSFFPPFKIYF